MRVSDLGENRCFGSFELTVYYTLLAMSTPMSQPPVNRFTVADIRKTFLAFYA
ncbi:MAG: hypothetical protein ACJA1Y_001042, partial [Burkholderiaceae bacterium]